MRKGQKSNSLDIHFKLPSDAELAAMFDMVPMLQKYNVGDKVIRAGAKPVVARARALAPKSSATGSTKKRSKKQQADADWNFPLWKSINYVVRKYQKHTEGVIGPEYPKGNDAYFNTSPKGRVRKLWGKVPGPDSKLSAIAPQVRNWIAQAFDETKSQQVEVMKSKLTVLLDEMFKKNG